MIGYNRLGINGRLGNQMFQYAALRGIAAKHGYDWCIPPPNKKKNKVVNSTHKIESAVYNLLDGFKMTHLSKSNLGYVPNLFKTYDEPSFDFDSDFFEKCPDNVNIDGFRQSEKYFKHIEKEIREDFEFIDCINIPCKEFIGQYGDDIIFLHVRRADATGRPNEFPVASVDWYEKMLDENFSKDVPVLILTDALGWVKEQKLFKQKRFLLSEQREFYNIPIWNGRGKLEYTLLPWIDFCLMSLCNGAIVPNSTFGWWGAWLQKNQNKKIVLQYPYFGSKFTNKHDSYRDLNDFYPEGWIRGNLPNEFIDTKYTDSENEITLQQ